MKKQLEKITKEDFIKTLQINTERINNLEKKIDDETLRTKLLLEKGIVEQNNEQDFMLDCQIRHFNISPEAQEMFFKELKLLMKKYRVFDIVATLLKKF